MELKEAIDELELIIFYASNFKITKDEEANFKIIKAIKTVLNYIENESIPKEKVKECLEDIYDYFDHIGQPFEDMEFLEEWKKKILEKRTAYIRSEQ